MTMSVVSVRDVFRVRPWTQILASGVTCFILFATEAGLSIYYFVQYDLRRTPSAFQALIIIYYFLPLSNQMHSLIFGSVMSLLFLVFNGIITFYEPDDDKTAFFQVLLFMQ